MNYNNDHLQVKIPNKIICNLKSSTSTSIARTVGIVLCKLCEHLSMNGSQGTSLCFPTGRKDRYRNCIF